MSDYTVSTDFLAKDALASGDPDKLVLGSELDVEFDAIAAAIATKLDAAGQMEQNSKSANYTLVLEDAGKHIYHPAGAGSGHTFTIPANASVAFEIGTWVEFINLATDSVSIAITTDTMYLSSAGTTGIRTLAQYGRARAVKVTSTAWLIYGTGLT